MRIFRLGSDAVGDYFGGRLFEAGCKVAFLEDTLGIVSKFELQLSPQSTCVVPTS